MGKVALPRTPPKGGQATPRNRRQGRKQLHPVHHPKEEQAVLERGSHADTEIDVKVQPYVARMFACSTRRDDALSAGPPSKRFSMNQQQQQTIICATTCGSGQRNGTSDSCRHLREIFRNSKETQQISIIQFRIPELLYRKLNFELSREVPLWFSSFCFFYFSFFSFLLMFSLFSSLFSFLPAEPKK